MGLGHSPRIITDGLVLALDAANPKNYNLTKVEVLVVAGGGGGGGWGGGGGAGGLIYSSNFAVTPGTQLTATVGGGGSAGTTNYTSGGDGTNSVFGALTAIGGGGGGHYPGVSGRNGGSGGGGGGNEGSSVQPGGTGTSGQGFSGGTSNSRNDGNYWGAGGGGGASEVGKNAVDLQGGNGGNGLLFNISGTSQFYAGGGGGHTPNAPGTAITTVGGLGGGGAGGRYYQSITAISGTPNTGGGGGGGYAGAAGGSGIVIVRYQGPQKAIGGTVTSVGGDTIHTFTTSGNFTPLVNTNNSAVLGLSDLSGNRNFGTTAGSPTYSGANGGSIVFDGTNDEVTTTTLFANPTVFTICSWFKTSTASGRKIIGFESNQTGTGTVSYDRQLYIGTDGKIYFGIYDGAAKVAVSTSTLNDGNWHNIVGTYGGEGTTMRLYVDGISNATATANYAQSYSGYWRISSYKSNFWTSAGDGYFTGNIANTQIYNRALTAAEISQNYNALRGRYGI